MKIAVIQGPNLNMLGIREQHIYGPMTLDQIHEQIKAQADQNGVELEFFQSNLEGELVDKVQECLGTVDGILINPAAYSHTSIALRDAITAVAMPTVEVHISNIYKREEFRQKSVTAAAATGIIAGFGPILGYHLGLMSLSHMINDRIAMQKAQEEAAKAPAAAPAV